jgi:hypothetical protein
LHLDKNTFRHAMGRFNLVNLVQLKRLRLASNRESYPVLPVNLTSLEIDKGRLLHWEAIATCLLLKRFVLTNNTRFEGEFHGTTTLERITTCGFPRPKDQLARLLQNIATRSS